MKSYANDKQFCKHLHLKVSSLNELDVQSYYAIRLAVVFVNLSVHVS